MIIYHFTWDLVYFKLVDIDLMSGGWKVFPRFIATTFLLVMGISLTLSFNRERLRTGRGNLFVKYLRRGAKIFGLGLIITLATYFFIGRGFVVFGILHLLGASSILAYPFLHRNRWVSLAAGIVLIGAGLYLDRLVVTFPWLLWLGVKQVGRYMVDYYPLLPWFGVALIGIFSGYTFYPGGMPRFNLPEALALLAPIRGLRFLGRHALLIYVIHQPILLGLLIGLGFGSMT
jgi:uncharacterized membrane protein